MKVNCLGKCEQGETQYLCNDVCQSTVLSCDGKCHESRKNKCPNSDHCIAEDPFICSEPVLIPGHGEMICSGLREQCENTQTKCDINQK